MFDKRPYSCGVRLWGFAREYSSAKGLTFFSGTPVAVLAGFALATSIQLMSVAAPDRAQQAAAACFVIASASFILAFITSTGAQAYSTAPSELLDLIPEARISERALEELVIQQRATFELVMKFIRRSTFLGVVGVLSSFAGLLSASAHSLAGPGLLATWIVVPVAASQVLWWFIRRWSWLNPRPRDIGAPTDRPPTRVSEEGVVSILGQSPVDYDLGSRVDTLDALREMTRRRGTDRVLHAVEEQLLPVVDGYRVRGGALHLLLIVEATHRLALACCFASPSVGGPIMLVDHETVALRFGRSFSAVQQTIETACHGRVERWRRVDQPDGLLVSDVVEADVRPFLAMFAP